MKEYLSQNLEPILLGILIGVLIMVFKEVTESIITKIAILNNK